MSSTVSNYQTADSSRSHRGVSGSRTDDSSGETTSGGFRLTGAQVVVLWSIMAGLLIMCFLFGFYAGRDQGLKVAFEQYSGQAARIPIVDPVASQLSVGTRANQELAAGTDVEASEDEASFDFSKDSKVAAALPDTSSATAVGVREVPTPVTTTPVTTTPATSNTKNEGGLQSGWYIQIAATKTSADADTILTKAKAADYSASAEKAVVSGRTFFRVLIGPYASRSEAEKMRQEVTRKKLSSAAPFLKRVS